MFKELFTEASFIKGQEYKVDMLDEDGNLMNTLFATFVKLRKGKFDGFRGRPGYLFSISRDDLKSSGVEAGDDLWLPSEEALWSYKVSKVK